MTLFVVLLMASSIGGMIGFVYWELAVGMRSFVNVWVIVLCVFIGIMFTIAYFGGKKKIQE
jgi:hypothetical protein